MRNPFAPATPVAKKLKVLLYGASGSGKTIAALTWPRPAVVDAEGGSELYRGRHGFEVLVFDTKNVLELEQAIQFVREDGGKSIDTLVIDPITVFYDVLKDATARQTKDGSLGFREWARVNARMKSVYNALTGLPVHVVVVARESIEYEGSGNDMRKTGQKPDSDKALPYIFDFVIRMNPDHRGALVKSRGVDMLQEKRTLPAVNWAAFEPIANLYLQGEQGRHIDDEQQAELLAEDMRDKDVAKQFMAVWREKTLSDAQILAALSVSRLSEWEHGRTAADTAVKEWLDKQLANAETSGAEKQERRMK
jgi:hypothetical protein